VATATNEIDEIRRQMAQIRRELHEDVQEVVAGAGAVTDWRRYIRMYPWASVGIAAATGYLIVPKRRRNVPRDITRQADVAEVREALSRSTRAEPEAKKTRKSLIGAGLGMLAPLAWRAAQNYAMGYLEQWVAQQQQQYMAASGPAHAASPGQARPTGMPPGGPAPPSGGGGARRPGNPPSF